MPQAVNLLTVPGLHLDRDEDFETAGCFTEIIRGWKMEAVEPDVMRGLQPAGARVTLDVIIPSPTGLTSERKQTATLYWTGLPTTVY